MDHYTKLELALRLRDQHTKRAFSAISDWTNNHPLLSTGASMIPFVGTPLMANNAINDFSNGRIMSGIGNTVGAGLGLVGMGAAGGLGKSLFQSGKSLFGLAKAPGAAFNFAKANIPGMASGIDSLAAGAAKQMPMLAKGWGAAKSLGNSTGSMMGGFLGKGVQKMEQGANAFDEVFNNKMPGMNRLVNNPLTNKVRGWNTTNPHTMSMFNNGADMVATNMRGPSISAEDQESGNSIADFIKQMGSDSLHMNVDPANIRPMN